MNANHTTARNWHYWPEHVVPARPVIGTITDLIGTDAPTVYQLPGSGRYYMSFVGFDGRGYQWFVAESDDRLHGGNHRLAMGFGPAGEFDHGGGVIGAFLCFISAWAVAARTSWWHSPAIWCTGFPHPEPLDQAGGNPSGLDRQSAHKISLVVHPRNDTFFMYYKAVPGGPDVTGGRGIGLITSKPLAR